MEKSNALVDRNYVQFSDTIDAFAGSHRKRIRIPCKVYNLLLTNDKIAKHQSEDQHVIKTYMYVPPLSNTRNKRRRGNDSE